MTDIRTFHLAHVKIQKKKKKKPRIKEYYLRGIYHLLTYSKTQNYKLVAFKGILILKSSVTLLKLSTGGGGGVNNPG